MQRPVVVFTHSGDLHASHFSDIASNYGLPFRLVFTDRFAADGGFSFRSEDGCLRLRDVFGDYFGLNEARAVWWRRISGVQQGHVIVEEYRNFVDASWRSLLEADLPFYCPNTTFVNDPSATRVGYNKLRQYKLAGSLGLKVPKTLISNDPAVIADFCTDREIMIKPLTVEGGMPVYVKEFDWSKVTKNSMGICPNIYQEKLSSPINYRVNVFGDKVITFRIENRRLDWRIGEAKVIQCDLDQDIVRRCVQFVRNSNLEIGMIDLKEDACGEVYFLENNPQGQFDFIQGYSGYELMKDFVDFIYSF